jgi:predicted acyltransferase
MFLKIMSNFLTVHKRQGEGNFIALVLFSVFGTMRKLLSNFVVRSQNAESLLFLSSGLYTRVGKFLDPEGLFSTTTAIM